MSTTFLSSGHPSFHLHNSNDLFRQNISSHSSSSSIMPVFSSLSRKLTGRNKSGTASSSSSTSNRRNEGHSSVASSQPSNATHLSPFSDPPPKYSPHGEAVNPTHAPVATSASRAGNANFDDQTESTLRMFDTVLLIDDSRSMVDYHHNEYRWSKTKEAVQFITPTCTKWDEDGIDIYFLNHKPIRKDEYQNVTTPDKVDAIFRPIQPNMGTPMAGRLGDILNPYMRQYRNREDPEMQKPLNIICITDGKPDDEWGLESYIRQVAEELDELRAVPWQVGIQFLQVGSDKDAADFLQRLDDSMHKETPGQKRCRDIVDTTKFSDVGKYRDLSDALLKILIGGVNKRYDAKHHSHS